MLAKLGKRCLHEKGIHRQQGTGIDWSADADNGHITTAMCSFVTTAVVMPV